MKLTLRFRALRNPLALLRQLRGVDPCRHHLTVENEGGTCCANCGAPL